MSAHFVHRHLRDKRSMSRGSPLRSPSTTSPFYHLNRPHTSTFNSYATPLELIVRLVAVLTLLALVIWLAWIGLQRCIKFTREKMDEFDVEKRTKKNVRRAEEAPKKVFQVGMNIGYGVGRAAKGLFEGFVRGEQGEEREAERRGLLRGNGSGERAEGSPRGVYIQGYGYDRERYGDGTIDGTSTRHTSVNVDHKEDGDGSCGLTPGRWSWSEDA